MNNKLPLLIFLLATAALSVYVWIFTPAIPIGDQWVDINLFLDPSLSNLWAIYNEHHVFFPRLIVVGLAYFSHWDLRWETISSLLFLAGFIAIIYWSFSCRVADTKAKLLFALVLLTQLSPIHHENILWGFSSFILSAFALFIAFTYISNAGNDLKALGLMLCSLFVASFSFFSGLLGWPICFVGVLLKKSWNWLNILILALTGFVVFRLYFIGFHTAASLVSVDWLQQLWLRICYFFIYLGSNYVPTYKVGIYLPVLLFSAGLWGVFLLILGIIFIRKSLKLNEDLAIPFSLMAFGLLAACLTAIGRAQLGLASAMLSRYHVYQMCYFVGLVWLILVYLSKKKALKQMAYPVVIICLIIFVLNWIAGIGLGIIKTRIYKPIEIELMDKQENISIDSANRIFNDPEKLREQIKKLKELKLNIFRQK